MRPPVSFGGPLAATSYPVAPGSLLPAPGSPTIAPNTADKTLQYVTINIPSNGIGTIVVAGSYFYIDTMTADGFEVYSSEYLTARPDSQNAAVAIRYSKASYRWEKPFDVLQFSNASAIVYVLKGWIGFGEIRSDRAAGVTTVGNSLAKASNAFSRPANVTPYAIGQILNKAGATPTSLSLFDLCKNASGVRNGTITHLQLMKSTTTTAGASFKLYIFDYAYPADAALADQQTFSLNGTPLVHYTIIGIVDFPAFVTGAAGWSFCDVAGLSIDVTGGFDPINAIIVTNAAYTPGNAEQFRLSAWGRTN
jgi:hypothetical protein